MRTYGMLYWLQFKGFLTLQSRYCGVCGRGCGQKKCP